MDTEEVFITDITHRGELAKPTEAASNHPSTLDLLSVVVPFTIADATADLSVHDQYMSENVEAFGRKGKQAVADFKVSRLLRFNILDYYILDDDPRSTPGHS